MREFDAEALRFELTSETLCHHVDHLNNFRLRQFVEHDCLVDAVQELGAEVRLECVVDFVLHAGVRHGFITLGESHVALAQI